MVKEYNTALQSTGKVFDPIVNKIRVIRPKAIKQKDIPSSKSSLKGGGEFFFIRFS